MTITLVLLGDIAAGKGTQARILVKKFGLKYLDTGEFTRSFWLGKSKTSQRLQRTKRGKLTPSDVIKKYLKKSLAQLSNRQGVLIDGGKMPSEASLLYRILRKQRRKVLVIFLHISRREIFRRLSRRYYCKNTGRPVTLKGQARFCPHCGGELIKRIDDQPRAVKNRISYYEKIYSKTINFWRAKRVLKVVNGQKAVSAVTKNLIRTIQTYYGRD